MSTLQEGIGRLDAFALPEQTKADVIELVEAAYELGAAEMRERCAVWYASNGWQLDEDAVPAEIRALPLAVIATEGNGRD